MEGTGSRGLRWLLVELSGPWGHSAFLESPLAIDAHIGRALVRRAEGAGMRIVAIRRSGRRLAEHRYRWAIADSTPGSESVHWGEVDTAEELLGIPLDGSTGIASADPLVAVCAHGKHDQCCAVRGRAVAATIAERYPEWTWECSHLGGDRFAATMLLLPHGLYYGRVDSAEPAELVRLYADGRLDERYFRGRSSLPNTVQAAQHHARLLTGEDRIDALAPLSIVESPPETTIVLDGADGPIEVRLAEELSAPILTTCAARVAGQVRQWRLLSITPARSGSD
ncbi:sucrase ferredoxin [Antrihabitans cavernicola]|uniref:Sucrase ferredoxin n=1 Tax=Antrihabitans cavernicola TaxID=2495913 RepID=A0A5A7SK40_9NOCA|nr:sucrase ferredoxin [Spelaeibacter cavernicola]KAA0025033.1 sucrase ferredoxin [Spelaeibacter cavernicola]